ncbi:MAG: dTDP-4-dehydrorhamnose 3,5-epimerase family protein [Lysobacter sp.]|nr:dTDP-4-dehydrorhamnose 3,5-epimerase family protein [Lysobacter sp.]
MKVSSAPLQGLQIVDSLPIIDARGRFERLYRESEWKTLRANLHFAEVNLSTTACAGTVRGMHFQRPPAAEAKLIHCLRGRVFDVAVDLRAASPTYLRWHAIQLDAEEPRAVFIPEGFAHGFQALSDGAQLLYLHTAPWTPGCEGGLRHDDPRLGIDWPLPVLQLSERDRTHPLLDDSFEGIAA